MGPARPDQKNCGETAHPVLKRGANEKNEHDLKAFGEAGVRQLY